MNQGWLHDKCGGLWVALDIDVVAAQVFKGPAFIVSCENSMRSTVLRIANLFERS